MSVSGTKRPPNCAIDAPAAVGVGLEEARVDGAGPERRPSGRSRRAARARLTNSATRNGSLVGRPGGRGLRLDAARDVDADGGDVEQGGRRRSRASRPPARMTGMRLATAAATCVDGARAGPAQDGRVGGVEQDGLEVRLRAVGGGPFDDPSAARSAASAARRRLRVSAAGTWRTLRTGSGIAIEVVRRLVAVELHRVQAEPRGDRGDLSAGSVGEDARRCAGRRRARRSHGQPRRAPPPRLP